MSDRNKKSLSKKNREKYKGWEKKCKKRNGKEQRNLDWKEKKDKTLKQYKEQGIKSRHKFKKKDRNIERKVSDRDKCK